MPNNQFKKGELYSFITGKASTAIARNTSISANRAASRTGSDGALALMSLPSRAAPTDADTLGSGSETTAPPRRAFRPA